MHYIAEELGCESASLFIVDQQNNQLWTKAMVDLDEVIRLPIDSGVIGQCVKTGEPIIIDDAYASPYFNSAVDEITDKTTKTILALPVFGPDQETVIAGKISWFPSHSIVIECMNKVDKSTFSKKDTRILSSMASHIATGKGYYT